MAAALFQGHSPVKYATADWHTSNMVMSSTAERQRSVSHDLRQQSHRLRNDTDNRTHWTQHTNTSRLQDRTDDIRMWIERLEKTLQDTENEIDKLTEHKQRAERCLEAKGLPLQVVLECLGLREGGRVGIDLVRDGVEGELGKELEVVEGVRALLHHKVSQAFQQICVLQQCHHRLHADLTDKYTALNIDSDCTVLTNKTDTIAFQSDPTRIKKDIVYPEQWESFSTHNTQEAMTEMHNSTQLCENINHTIQQTTSDLETQWIATNFAFRKRTHEMEKTIAELEYQKKTTESEIREVEQEVEDLERALADKVPPMMVTHTRLDNRTYRPNVELCRDNPQYRLVDEVAEISDTQQSLREKLGVAEYTLASLQRTLQRIAHDLQVKNNSLSIDLKCTEVRGQLAQHPKPHQLYDNVDHVPGGAIAPGNQQVA